MANKMDPAFAKAMDGDWVVVEKEDGDGEEPTAAQPSPNPSPFGGQMEQGAFDMLPASSNEGTAWRQRACHSNVLVVS